MLIWGIPTFFAKNVTFCLGIGKNFSLNLGYLLVRAFSESLSKIGNDKDWGWENFHLQPWPFIGLSFSRKFEQSKTWLSFLSWFLGSSLFCKKIKIVLRDWKTFHLQTWSFNGLSFSWKFEQKSTGFRFFADFYPIFINYIQNLSSLVVLNIISYQQMWSFHPFNPIPEVRAV